MSKDSWYSQQPIISKGVTAAKAAVGIVPMVSIATNAFSGKIAVYLAQKTALKDCKKGFYKKTFTLNFEL